MATKHVLALDIPETAIPHNLRIVDASVYATGLLIDCPRLDIYLPGFTTPIYITDNLDPGFSINLSGIDLSLQTASLSPMVVLGDGVYTIRYSVSPNDVVFVEYLHLRTTNTMNKYYRLLCELELNACDPEVYVKKQLDTLHDIRMYISAAKAKVEYCHDIKKGMELFIYAQKLLNKFSINGCFNC